MKKVFLDFISEIIAQEKQLFMKIMVMIDVVQLMNE